MKNITLIITLFTLFLTACDEDEAINKKELEIQLSSEKNKIVVGTTVKLNYHSDSYPIKDLNVNWFCTNGEFGLKTEGKFTISNPINSNNVYWQAPFETGTFEIVCHLTDSLNNLTESKIVIEVYRPTYSKTETLYSNKRLINDIEILNGDSLYTFNTSFYDSERTSPLINDDLLLIKDYDITEVLNTSLFDNYYYYSSTWISDTVDNLFGFLPLELQIKLEYYNKYLYLSSSFNSYNIKKIGLNPYRAITIPWNGYRILDIETNFGGELFAITSPRYENSEIILPPIIWKLNEFNEPEKIFEFPLNYKYDGAGYGNGYPSSVKYDLAFDKDDNLYIAMPYSEKIFILDTNNNLDIFNENIFCPSSIVITENNFKYIVSSPAYSEKWQKIKPLQIILIDEQGHTEIIEEMNTDYLNSGGSLAKMQDGESYLLSGSIKNDIEINEDFEVFFIDSRKGVVEKIN